MITLDAHWRKNLEENENGYRPHLPLVSAGGQEDAEDGL